MSNYSISLEFADRASSLNPETNVCGCDRFGCEYHAEKTKKCNATAKGLDIKGCFKRFRNRSDSKESVRIWDIAPRYEKTPEERQKIKDMILAGGKRGRRKINAEQREATIERNKLIYELGMKGVDRGEIGREFSVTRNFVSGVISEMEKEERGELPTTQELLEAGITDDSDEEEMMEDEQIG